MQLFMIPMDGIKNNKEIKNMTKQSLTFNTLDSYFLDTEDNHLNIGYLRDNLLDQFDIVQRNINRGNGESLLTANLKNTRRSIKSLVWEAFIKMINGYIENETGNKKYTCTSAQLKKYLANYGYTLEEALGPVIDEVTILRNNIDYVAVGYDAIGKVRAFSTGTKDCCQSAAKAYRRKKDGFRVYPTVKVMTWEEWEKVREDL